MMVVLMIVMFWQWMPAVLYISPSTRDDCPNHVACGRAEGGEGTPGAKGLEHGWNAWNADPGYGDKE